MASSWNADRSEQVRAIRSAQKVVFQRNRSITSATNGRLDYPLVCHVFPLGRLKPGALDDPLAHIGAEAGKLVPPGFPDLYVGWKADGVEFYADPKRGWLDRDFWLSWFRSGGAEVRAHRTRTVTFVDLIDRVIPFLGITACTVLRQAPPIFVSITASGSAGDFGLEPSPADSGSRLLEPQNYLPSTLPPMVVNDVKDFGEGWRRHAETLLHQFAQAFGRPAFDRQSWMQRKQW